MSDARSLTPLSQADYDAIEAAVLETARGRWFMAEYAKRNRQADTQQLLTAIGRIERVVGLSVQETSRETNIVEAAALIGDLRADLERISGRTEQRSSGLAARIEGSAGAIATATEGIQEAAWILRESGADETLCDQLDRHAAEITGAIGAIDGVGRRIGKIADTIAMLDTSLRAFGEASYTPATRLFDGEDFGARKTWAVADLAADPAPPAAAELYVPAEPNPIDDIATPEQRMATIELLDDDLVFADAGAAMPTRPTAPAERSEAGLRAIDEMPTDRKLAYFA